LGEFEQGRPLMEHIKRQHPQVALLVTFFSPSGYNVHKAYPAADLVMYLPLDSRRQASEFLELTRPMAAVFIKYEFWYYYLSTLKNQGIPTYSVSSIFRQSQIFFKPWGGFYRSWLQMFDHFFVQNAQSEKLLRQIGLQNVTTTGDTRFDRVIEICSKPKSIPVVESFKAGHRLMVVGSSWPADIDVLAPVINDLTVPLKFVIAPHEIDPDKLQVLERKLHVKFKRYSAADASVAESRVLIIDNIGMLSSIYQYGEFAYIGGAFGSGVHNILEAATYGVPVFFGKGKTNVKYQEAIDLVANGGAYDVTDANDFRKKLINLLDSPAALEKAGNKAGEYVRQSAGATQKIMQHLQPLFTP
jgi:3-deoxy-D-manno-octulosonic-acid transferase